MTPTLSLRELNEPTYVLAGVLLPQDPADPDAVEVVVAPDAVDDYPAAARPVLEYLSVLRGRSDALTDLAPWDAEPDELDRLVAAGVLIGFPASDETAVREVIAPLALAITAKTKVASDGKTLLLLLPNERAVIMGSSTLAVLGDQTARPLGTGVAAVAAEAHVDLDWVWRHLLVDLTAILGTGAGALTHLERAGDGPETSKALDPAHRDEGPSGSTHQRAESNSPAKAGELE